MPRETIQYGRDFAKVTVPPSETHSGYEYELDARTAKAKLESGELHKSNVRFDAKPHLDILWSRPISHMSLPAGEEPNGSVQVQITMSPATMQDRINHIAAHPEDLEHFANVFTEPLTRSQINQMIRHLKRARDAAYGTDE